ncbi:MAG: 30S ribosomal protein S17 [Thermodesulfobacteriota bacterium]
MERSRGKRKCQTGIVIKDGMERSVVVSVERTVQHPLYGKYIKRSVKYMAHDDKGECRAGDRVTIVETRPVSRMKRWRVSEVVEKAK